MSLENKFSEKDVENLVKLLNFISDKAQFTVNVQETIAFYKLLAWSQTELKKKMEDHVFEIKKVVNAPVEPSKKSK